MKKIIAVQLPGKHKHTKHVFAQALQALINDGYRVDLITNEENAHSYLNNIDIDTHIIGKASTNPLGYVITQLKLFFTILRMAKAGHTVYINSIFPFGAALAAKIRNAKVIYHLEQASRPSSMVQYVLRAIVNRTADQVIFTSATLKDYLRLSVKKQIIVYPSVSTAEAHNARHSFTNSHVPFTVGMIVPAKANAGISSFLKLAEMMPHINFDLVISGSTDTLKYYLGKKDLTANLSVSAKEDNLEPFFEKVSVLVNLSENKNRLAPCDINILHAMHYGKPVIVPAMGATKEFMDTKRHGVAINFDHLDAISDALRILQQNAPLYNSMSAACRQQAALFSPEQFDKQIVTLFKGDTQSIYNTLDQIFGSAFFNTQLTKLSKQQAA